MWIDVSLINNAAQNTTQSTIHNKSTQYNGPQKNIVSSIDTSSYEKMDMDLNRIYNAAPPDTFMIVVTQADLAPLKKLFSKKQR
jgi:hypothetical protein